MGEFILEADGLTITLGGKKLLNNISFRIRKGEQWAFVGESGSGKTFLAETIKGKHFFRGQLIINNGNEEGVVVFVPQQHHFKNRSNTSDFYYQQRYNSYDAETTVTVRQWLDGDEDIVRLLGLEPLLDEPLIQLSNGENKRLQLAAALLQDPFLLIMDQPYVGLDIDARKLLNEILAALIQKGIHIIIMTSSAHIPQIATHVATLHHGELISVLDKRAFESANESTPADEFDPTTESTLLGEYAAHIRNLDFVEIIRMNKVSLVYGDKQILDQISWVVKKGERWCLSGPNGAGKSSLLSLITGDNPQAYANEIFLFDRRRGTGETIWEIKNRIGYVSPEMHLHFEMGQTVREAVASGFFDTIGLFKILTDEQEQATMRWLRLFNIEKFADLRLNQLPASQQRLALIARALVKFPPVLILDEPGQGLDPIQISKLKKLISHICEQTGVTLIYISHYREDIPDLVNHFLELKKGKIFSKISEGASNDL